MQGYNKKCSIAFLLITILLLFSVGTAFAAEEDVQPLPLLPPAIYFGSIQTESGQPVDNGILKAYVETELCGSLPFTGGSYGLPSDDPNIKRLLVYSSTRDITGKEVVFRVFTEGKEYSAITAPAQVIWESRQRQEVNLIVSSTPAPFMDLQGHWAAETVQQFVYKGIISGYEDYTFRPDDTIDRAECAAVLSRALALPAGSQADLAGFRDSTNIPAWASNPVSAAVKAGLIKGYPEEDGTMTFRPELPVTRVELAVILSRVAVQKLGSQQLPAAGFADWDQVPAWAQADVSVAGGLDLIKGYPDGAFKPAKEVTRAEAATMMARLLEKI